MDELTRAHASFLEGSVPTPSSVHVAMVMMSSLRRPGPCGDRWELTGLGLSLLRDISSGVLAQSLPADALHSWGETLRLLLEDLDLISQLVHLFRAEDQLICHLAASSASVLIFYQLQQSEDLHPVWQQKCVQALQSAAPGPELDAFLWSLTDIFRKLLKGAHQELLGRLLLTLDCSLRAVFEKFLCGRPEDPRPCGEQRRATTFCLLLDLLEVLTRTDPVLTPIPWSALLAVVSGSSQYLVKKRTLLLLKRTVCQRAGEDWSVGALRSTRPEHEAKQLAESVLAALQQNWLQAVPVQGAAFFGGTRLLRGGQGADQVMLRAVSLLLLKSIELHAQAEGEWCNTSTRVMFMSQRRCEEQLQQVVQFYRRWGVGGLNRKPGTSGDSAARLNHDLLLWSESGEDEEKVQVIAAWTDTFCQMMVRSMLDRTMLDAAAACRHLQLLWTFWRQHSQLLSQVTHLCSWISLLFADQDDDLMEAQSLSLSLFLRVRRGSVWDGSSCSSGFNPHCHFLLLLQSICFDHSILLDFLISSETCFLEYLVHYLKYLKEDWRGFTAACGGPGHRSGPGSCALTHAGLGSSLQPLCAGPPVGGSVSAAGLRLVAYDSSDESESEAMNQEAEAASASVPQDESAAAPLTGADSTWERVPEGPSSHKRGASAWRREGGHPAEEAVRCLSELREVLTRLQRKKLFPYNPTPLLKLLAQVLSCCQRSEPSQ